MKELSIEEYVKNLGEDIACSSLYVQHHNKAKNFVAKVYNFRSFIDDLAVLMSDRDYRLFQDNTQYSAFSTNIILRSATHTLCSIASCLYLGNIADTYMLIRKYRDDLFSYLYLLPNNEKIFDKADKEEKDATAWLKSELKDLTLGQILKSIADDVICSDAVQKFQLKKFTDKISNTINNYTHSNGIAYYNYLVDEQSEKELIKQIDEMTEILEKCTCYFVFLLILKSQFLVTSTDYEDCLECGINPPDNAKQSCVPFVQTFIDEHQAIFGVEMIDYLKLYSSIDFE